MSKLFVHREMLDTLSTVFVLLWILMWCSTLCAYFSVPRTSFRPEGGYQGVPQDPIEKLGIKSKFGAFRRLFLFIFLNCFCFFFLWTRKNRQQIMNTPILEKIYVHWAHISEHKWPDNSPTTSQSQSFNFNLFN